MNKQEYLAQLRAALACLPEGEIEESVAFYTEMIDDRVADGLTEEEATAQLDDPKAAARAIIADLPVVPRTVVRTKQRNRALYWTLVILGSPLWLTLLLAAGMLVLAGLLTIWCLILGLWLLAAGLPARHRRVPMGAGCGSASLWCVRAGIGPSLLRSGAVLLARGRGRQQDAHASVAPVDREGQGALCEGERRGRGRLRRKGDRP